MALELTENIDDEQRFIAVTGDVPEDIEPGYEFRIGDEPFRLQGFVVPQHKLTEADRNRWYVVRGPNGTAAPHTAGDPILGAADALVASASGTTPPNPFAPGGGGGPVIESFPFTFEDVQAIWDNGVAASLVAYEGDPTKEIVFTAVSTGVWGNDVTVALVIPPYVDPGGGGDMPMGALVLDGLALTVPLAVHPDSDSASTAGDVVDAITADGMVSAVVTAALGGSGTGIVSSYDQALAGGADPSGLNFLPLTTLNPGDKVLNAWPSITATPNNGTEGVSPAARIGDDFAALGTIQWDLHHAGPDDVDSANGLSQSIVDPADAAAYDTFLGWPKTATLEAELGLQFSDVGGDGAPDEGEVTIDFLIARVA